ncbi:hypothetical protein [Chitinolyticbacter albus]|uniref:hypothetical protein n=1 Tax=Chitinolyticbacter albus TaxID=2961951 RepID=UPI00210E5491|nr:hypothetical protein [Chitinolyticbacter albus]
MTTARKIRPLLTHLFAATVGASIALWFMPYLEAKLRTPPPETDVDRLYRFMLSIPAHEIMEADKAYKSDISIAAKAYAQERAIKWAFEMKPEPRKNARNYEIAVLHAKLGILQAQQGDQAIANKNFATSMEYWQKMGIHFQSQDRLLTAFDAYGTPGFVTAVKKHAVFDAGKQPQLTKATKSE